MCVKIDFYMNGYMVQVAGSADSKKEESYLMRYIVSCAEIAERNHGTPENDIPCLKKADLVVHCTYRFLSMDDLKSFLSEAPSNTEF